MEGKLLDQIYLKGNPCVIFHENVFLERLHEKEKFVKWCNEHSEVQAELNRYEAEIIAQAEENGITMNDDFRYYLNNVLIKKAINMFKDYLAVQDYERKTNPIS